eukprot:scaffold31278_cov74-Phaeocystis_antarctica.AAC.3
MALPSFATGLNSALRPVPCPTGAGAAPGTGGRYNPSVLDSAGSYGCCRRLRGWRTGARASQRRSRLRPRASPAGYGPLILLPRVGPTAELVAVAVLSLHALAAVERAAAAVAARRAAFALARAHATGRQRDSLHRAALPLGCYHTAIRVLRGARHRRSRGWHHWHWRRHRHWRRCLAQGRHLRYRRNNGRWRLHRHRRRVRVVGTDGVRVRRVGGGDGGGGGIHVRLLVDRLRPEGRGQLGLDPGVAIDARGRAVVVVDDGLDAAVVRGHEAQVGRGQPAQRDALEPAALVEQLVEHLVVGGVLVGDRAANIGRVPVGEVGLVGPEVEERHVARPLRPRVVEEELGELVELEVDVEEDDGLERLLHLVEEEEGLEGDHPIAECVGALGRLGPHEVGSDHGGLAAQALHVARAEKPPRLLLVRGREERHAHELDLRRLAPDAHQDALRVVKGPLRLRVTHGVLGRVVRQLARAPDRIVRRRAEERRVHTARAALFGLVEPVLAGAFACGGALDALVLCHVRAARRGLPRALWQARVQLALLDDQGHQVCIPRRQGGRVHRRDVLVRARLGPDDNLLADAQVVEGVLLVLGPVRAVDHGRGGRAPGIGHASRVRPAFARRVLVVARGQVQVAHVLDAVAPGATLHAALDGSVVPRLSAAGPGRIIAPIGIGRRRLRRGVLGL